MFKRELYVPGYLPSGKEIAVIETNKGTIKVQLAGLDAPIHVGNFIELSNKGFYNGLTFHRYVPGFVIQGGDPDGTGMGGPGYAIQHEYDINPNNRHEDGALAMARSQHPDSAGSQFYFCLGPQYGLDSGYTVFGQTIEGLDVVHSLRQGDTIVSIKIENMDE